MFTSEQHKLERKVTRTNEILQASFFFPQTARRLSLRLCGGFDSLFEAKRKVFNLIFNFNPLKYVSDLEMYKLKLAEDLTGKKLGNFFQLCNNKGVQS